MLKNDWNKDFMEFLWNFLMCGAPEHPVIVVMDSYISNVTAEALIFHQENGIVFVTFLYIPHFFCSHLMHWCLSL
jgi:hypothetical protein